MIVKAHIAGVFGQDPVTAEGEVSLTDGACLEQFFEEADKAFGFGRAKLFRTALKMSTPPVILLNGDRVDQPDGLKHRLKDGDEITVITPLTGG